ncbi:MAG: glycosyltransferase 87 family protein [Bacteroidia bacterium]|nr:glycosyltransferase 87 family protein [Bacteroidia bacterium]
MKSLLTWYKSHPASDLWIGAAPSMLLLVLLLHDTERVQSLRLLCLWMLLFGIYAGWILRYRQDHAWLPGKEHIRLQSGMGIGIALRLIAATAIPVLSDDYFRFLWDGQLWLEGINPFTMLPRSLAEDPGRLEALGLSMSWFDSLNSPDFFTIYPPVLQALFILGASTGSIVAGVFVLKGSILIAELLNLFLLDRILRRLGRPRHWALWYALNPLVIVELCGSLHFEALMITFVLAAIYFLLSGKYDLSALMLGLGVVTKLLPLIFLPFLIRRIGWKASIRYGFITGLVVLLCFLPLLSAEMLNGFRESLSLYVNRFEFNAGLWYAVRWVGMQITGWNLIREIGPWFTPVAAGLILGYTLLERNPNKKNWATTMLYSLTIYFFLSLIVHPWYICTLVLLAPLANKRFPLLWSVWLPFTYLAYQVEPVTESMWLIACEYLSVLIFLMVENKGKPRQVVLL